MTAATGEVPARPGRSAPPCVLPMVNPVRDYDWGSTTALAALQGRPPAGGPEAELWMGGHPASPSAVLVDGAEVPLPQFLSADPAGVLGAGVVERFGPRLPFLLKVLAIALPLSVQVHPDSARAREAYDPAGGSPYVDPFHKPELLHALEPVSALFGFRPAAESAALLDSLLPAAGGRLARLRDLLLGSPATGADDEVARLHATLAACVTWPDDDRAALVEEVRAGLAGARAGGGVAAGTGAGSPWHWVERLVGLHPRDPMVLAPLLLDLVHLAPGDSVFVPAGVPHCYLSGLGVEILAASDNVLRCGLTSKAVAVEELLHVVDCTPRPGAGVAPEAVGPGVVALRPPVPDFDLLRMEVQGPAVLPAPEPDGPRVVLCTAGRVSAAAGGAEVAVAPGGSAFVVAGAGPLTLTGEGTAFVAGVGR